MTIINILHKVFFYKINLPVRLFFSRIWTIFFISLSYFCCSISHHVEAHIPWDTPPSSCHITVLDNSDHSYYCNLSHTFRRHILLKIAAFVSCFVNICTIIIIIIIFDKGYPSFHLLDVRIRCLHMLFIFDCSLHILFTYAPKKIFIAGCWLH